MTHATTLAFCAIKLQARTATFRQDIFLAAKRIDPCDRQLPWEILLVLNSTLLFWAGCLIQTPDTPLLLFWAKTYTDIGENTNGGRMSRAIHP